ncbi:MAG: histidinol-phosphatase HisJ family protein [Candidatus Limnocylindrales bacterium]
MTSELPRPAGLQARDLPVDAHVHTNLSPDSGVPIDVYAALAVELGIAEFAVTDHVDFDARDPAYDYSTFAERERVARDAAERWAGRGLAIRFGAELTFNTSWEADLRDHLARHRYDFTIGSVHDWPDSPYIPSRVGTWATSRPLDEVLAPYLEQVTAAARSGLFDTIGHIDVVKRYLHPRIGTAALAERADLFEPALAALVESGTALEVNTSGLHHGFGETYPPAGLVNRFRELGGARITTGSDAHRPEWLAYRLDEAYRIAGEAGFDAVTFRRAPRAAGSERVSIALPERFARPGPVSR